MTDSSKSRVALLLGVTFLAGMAAGVAADRTLGVDPTGDVPKQAEADGRRERHGGGTTIERFADELGLTQEQRARIDPILEATREQMSELFEPVRPAYRELVDSTRAQIETILTPQQVTEYRRLLDRQYGGDHERPDRDERNEGGTGN